MEAVGKLHLDLDTHTPQSALLCSPFNSGRVRVLFQAMARFMIPLLLATVLLAAHGANARTLRDLLQATVISTGSSSATGPATISTSDSSASTLGNVGQGSTTNTADSFLGGTTNTRGTIDIISPLNNARLETFSNARGSSSAASQSQGTAGVYGNGSVFGSGSSDGAASGPGSSTQTGTTFRFGNINFPTGGGGFPTFSSAISGN